MFSLDHPLKSPLFDYFAPMSDQYRGFVSIPHSGEVIPDEFKGFLSGEERAYKEDVDYKVNELIDIEALQKAGIAVLVAHVHRICVDLNRAEANCILFWKENTQGKKIVTKDPNNHEVARFIETYHRPYFELIKAAMRDLEKRKAGPVSMIDLHSMPSRPTDYHMKQNPNQKLERADFCVSDRKGLTCTPEFINFFKDALSVNGYKASVNDPYVGGYVTEYVNQFRTNNIQIEINRSIYMNEQTKELTPEKVLGLKTLLTSVIIEGMKKFDS